MNRLEKGQKFVFEIPEIQFKAELPWIVIRVNDEKLKIASLNLIGMIEWNLILGKGIAKRIREAVSDLDGVVLFTAVEKALQLSQVVASELGLKQIAVAYNKVKPHMEAENRPVIQVGGSGSITSGEKFLVVYERDANLLSSARGVIIIDDVVSKGGTIAALAEIVDQVKVQRNLPDDTLKILGVFCIATEGKPLYRLAKKPHALGELPAPQIIE